MSNNQYVASDGSIVVGISPAAYEAYLAEKASNQTPPSAPSNIVLTPAPSNDPIGGGGYTDFTDPTGDNYIPPPADDSSSYTPPSAPSNIVLTPAQNNEPIGGGYTDFTDSGSSNYIPPPATGSYAKPINTTGQTVDANDAANRPFTTTTNQPQPIQAVNPFTTQKNTIKSVNNQQNITDFAVAKSGDFFNAPSQNEDYAQPFGVPSAPEGIFLTKPSDNRVVGREPQKGTGNLLFDTIGGIGESFVKAGETMFFNPAGEFDFYMQPEKTGNLATDLFVAGLEGGLNALSLGMFSNVKYAQRLHEYEQADGSGLDRLMSQITVGTSVLGAGSAVGLGVSAVKTGTASIGKSGLLTVGKEIASANKGQIFNFANEAAIVTTTTDPNLSSEDKLTTVGTSLVLGGAFGAGTKAAGTILPRVLGGVTKTKTVTTGGITTETTSSLWDTFNRPLVSGKSTIGKIISPITTPSTLPLTGLGGIYAVDVGSRIASSDDPLRTGVNIYSTEILPMAVGAKLGYGAVSKVADTARDYLSTFSYLKSASGGDKVKFTDVGKYIKENTLAETKSDPMIALFDARNLQQKNVVKSFELNQHYPDIPTNAPKGYTNEPSRSQAMTDRLSTLDPDTLLLYHVAPSGRPLKGDIVIGSGASEHLGLYNAARPQSYYAKIKPYAKSQFSLFNNIPSGDPIVMGTEAKAATYFKIKGKWSDLTPEQRTKINVDIYKSLEGKPAQERVYATADKAEKEWIIAPNTVLRDVTMQPQWYMIKGRRVPYLQKEIIGKKGVTPDTSTKTETIYDKASSKSSSYYNKNIDELSISNMLGTRSFTGSDSKKDGGYKSSSDYLPSSTKAGGSSSRLGDDYSRSGDSSTKSDESYITDVSYSVRGGSSDIFGGSSSARGGSSSTRGGSSSTRGGSSSTRGGSGGSSIQPYNPYIPTFPEIPRKKKDEDDPQKSKNRRENKGIMDFFEVHHREIATADQFSGGLFGGDNIQTRDNFYLGYDTFMSKTENGIRTAARKRTVKPAVKRYAKIRTNPTFDLGLGSFAVKSKPAKKGKGVNKKALQFF